MFTVLSTKTPCSHPPLRHRSNPVIRLCVLIETETQPGVSSGKLILPPSSTPHTHNPIDSFSKRWIGLVKMGPRSYSLAQTTLPFSGDLSHCLIFCY